MDSKLIVVAVVGLLLGAGIAAAFTLGGEDSNEVPEESTSSNYLMIFGNANGDYLIDENDKQTVQDVIDKKISTNDLPRVKDNTGKVYCLADINNDNKVDAKDIEDIDKLINRTCDHMDIIDTFGYKLSVPMKIDRIACDYFGTAELLQMVGVQDKVVAASHALLVLKDYYLQGVPDTSKVKDFGMRWAPGEDVENADCNPDVWVMSENYHDKIAAVSDAVLIGLDTLTFDFDNIENSSPIQSAMLAGYIFNNVEKAQAYVDWYLEKWNYFHDKTKDLADSDRPVVGFTGYGGYFKDGSNSLRYFPENTVPWQAVQLAGGHNLFDDYDGAGVLPVPSKPTSNVNGDFEWMVTQEYDYLFIHCTKYTGKGDIVPYVPDHGYLCNDNSEWVKAQHDAALLDPFKDSVPAENVYLSPGDYMNSASGGILNTAMVAMVIHPDLFPDLDLLELQQEYVDLMGFEFDVSENGVFFAEN